MTTVMAGHVFGQHTITPQWFRSYHQVAVRDLLTDRKIVELVAYETDGAHIARGRCSIVESFLTHPRDPEWLWFTDTDATFGDDTLDRLLAAADPDTRPIVGALAFGARYKQLNAVGAGEPDLFPTIYISDGDIIQIAYDYPRDALVRCASTGAHCLLIHRRVLEDGGWHDGHPNPWFRMAIYRGREVSEDQWFCLRAGQLGYPIHVDTRVKTGHVKSFIADEDCYLRGRDDDD